MTPHRWLLAACGAAACVTGCGENGGSGESSDIADSTHYAEVGADDIDADPLDLSSDSRDDAVEIPPSDAPAETTADGAHSDVGPTPACGDTERNTGPGGAEWTACRGLVGATLRPSVRIAGAWHTSESCEGTAAVSCAVPPFGEVRVQFDRDSVWASFVAADAMDVEGIALDGTLTLPGATSFLSEGFQSWSQTGWVAIGSPDDSTTDLELRKTGDAEVLRTGQAFSWWQTLVGGGDVAFFAGALTSSRWKSWVQIARTEEPSVFRLRLVSGGTGETVAVDPETEVIGERWFVEFALESESLVRTWADRLASRRRTDRPDAELGWNSWYELWDTVDAEAVLANAALALERLAPIAPGGAPPIRIVIDDGWQQAWGEWSPNAKFPNGVDGVVDELEALGVEAGIWLAPLLVDADSALVDDHPEWFVGGATYAHAKHGPMRVLDVTNPEAAAHLREAIRRITGWGITLLKIDFLFAGAMEGIRSEAVTGIEAYQRALALIREAAGEETLLLAVGAPGLPSLPWVDAWRFGPDIAVESFGASWPFLPGEVRTLAGRWGYCTATLCDADPPVLRDLAQSEALAGLWTVAFSGGAFFLSDDLRELDPERFGWIEADHVAGALSGTPAVPLDVFPSAPPRTLANALGDQFRGTSSHVVPTHWRLPDGREVGWNATETPIRVSDSDVPARSARIVSE